MEYNEPEEIAEADAARFRDLMLAVSPAVSCLIASQLSRAYKSGRNRGRSEGFANGFACGVPLATEADAS